MPAVFDVIRVACRQQWNLQDDQVNVLHFEYQALATPNTDAAVMEDIAEQISDAYALIEARISNLVTAVDLTFYNVTADAPMGQRSWHPAYTGGTGAGESLPTHDSCLVLMQTAVKRTTGRIYLPTFTESATVNSNWVAGVHTDVDAFASMFIGNFPGATFAGEYQYCVFKRSSGAKAFPLSARVSPLVAIQSRRKRGRGS